MISPKLFSDHLKIINELMETASAPGAYCLGMLTAAGYERGWLPTRIEMKQLLQCESIEEGGQAVSRVIAIHQTQERERKRKQ
jgi:hypothetical protein